MNEQENAAKYCTCTDKACALHPSNHSKGCTPCVQKNLRDREIPSCFFKKCTDERPPAYFFENFAAVVEAAKGSGTSGDSQKNGKDP